MLCKATISHSGPVPVIPYADGFERSGRPSSPKVVSRRHWWGGRGGCRFWPATLTENRPEVATRSEPSLRSHGSHTLVLGYCVLLVEGCSCGHNRHVRTARARVRLPLHLNCPPTFLNSTFTAIQSKACNLVIACPCPNTIPQRHIPTGSPSTAFMCPRPRQRWISGEGPAVDCFPALKCPRRMKGPRWIRLCGVCGRSR